MRLKPFLPVIMILVVIVMIAKMSMAYVDPIDRAAGDNAVFSTLSRQVYLTSSTTADLSSTDLVGTTLTPPYKLVITNIGATNIYRGLLAAPTATCTALIASGQWSMTMHQAPNFYMRNAAAAANLCVEVWTK